MKNALTLATLPAAVRAEADLWHRAFVDLTPPITANLASLARSFGVSFATARRKYSTWQASGGDRLSLVNRAKISQPRTTMPDPAAFRAWFVTLAEDNQRSTKAAWRSFCLQWQAGAEIPGLDNSLPRHTLPRGCSFTNLERLVRDRFALAATRRGLGFAIAKHGPKIWSTRVGMQPGMSYAFDDLWHDNFVIHRGQIVRVLEFDCLDIASGCKTSWGTQPRLKREDGIMTGLGEASMRLILANVLFNDGYHPDGCLLLAEHGTAAIRERIEQLLYDHTGQIVHVQRSGMTGAQQAVLGWHGQAKGNPRHKASLESLRNLIHNELAALPGQTGLSRETRPEQTHGILAQTDDLLLAAQNLARTRPQLIQHLRLPLLQYHAHFLPVLQAIYAQINHRTWHHLEGWVESGHIAIEYRLSPDTADWLNQQQFLALPEDTRAMVLSAASGVAASRQSAASYLRERKLSPHEVWTPGRQQLRRIPAWLAAEILGEDMAVERTTRSGYFEFQDTDLAPEILRYDARITDPEGHTRELPPGKYLTFVNPFNLSQLFVHDAKNIHLGIAPRSTRIQRNDRDAAESALHYRSQRLAEMLQPLKSRRIPELQKAAADAAHNADLLAPDPVTPDQKQQLNYQRQLEQLADELI